jgi:uncharacterized membrane protein YdjX (TVP38/TMEM64 family)
MALLLTGIGWLASGHSLGFARELLNQFGDAGPVAFIVMGTTMMSLFIPKTLISIAAGGLFAMPDGCWVLSATAVVSAIVNYHIGRWSLSGARQQLNERQALSPSWLGRVSDTVQDGGVGLHLMIRLAPIPTTIISYSMGASGARQGPYILAALLATIPQWLWVYCGAMVTDSSQSTAKWTGVALSAVAAIALSAWLTRFFGSHGLSGSKSLLDSKGLPSSPSD